MERKILNYRIIIEPDLRTGAKKSCYSAFCPTFGISDSGDTIDETIKNIKEAIEVWVESLVEDHQPVPTDQIDESIVTYTSIKAPPNICLGV